MDALFRIEIFLAGIMIGMPYLGEEGVVSSLPIKIPGRGHALRTPVTRFEDGVGFGLEFMPGRTFPIQAG